MIKKTLKNIIYFKKKKEFLDEIRKRIVLDPNFLKGAE